MRGIGITVANMLFPRTCSGCGTSLQDEGLSVCWDCRARLSVIAPPFCSVCGEPVHGHIDHDYQCHTCCRQPPHYRHARAAIHYNETGRALVTGFKYNHAFWNQPLLIDLLEAAARSHYAIRDYDLMVAVPLHGMKQRERGYNQSMLLAKSLGKRLGIPVAKPGWLIRVRATPSQTRLTARRRLTNVRGAFRAGRFADWKNRRILLLDDVMTTGATVSECAKVLKDAGARVVDVITLARGV